MPASDSTGLQTTLVRRCPRMKLCISCNHRFDSSDWTCPACEWAPGIRETFAHFAPELSEDNDHFVREAFKELAAIEPLSFWFVQRNQNILWALNRYFPESRAICEIGCGTAFVLQALRRARPTASFVGCEVFTEALRYAKERLNQDPSTAGTGSLELLQVDARKMPFAEEFDLVCAFDVLEHIPEDEVVLGKLFESLSEGGGLLLTVPQHPSLWSTEDDYSGHQRRYTRTELLDKVGGAGFEVLRVTSFVSLLLPLLVVQRQLSRFQRKTTPGGYALRPSAPLNAALGFALQLERLWIRAGGNWPAGGSLLLAARKRS